MPRRRLHGETQKRRQKKRTRVLKLRDSTARVQQTQRPMSYEASPELERQDLEFLEAMRDLSVHRMPGAGGLPPRRAAIERAHFASDQENEQAFDAAMAGLGVRRLEEGLDPPVPSRPPRRSSVTPLDAEPIDEPATPPPRRPAVVAPPPRPASRTQFATSAEDAALMEQALREGVATLNEKFQGAPPPKPLRRTRAPERESTTAPDAELDLHGATQEQAIRRVQGFLLTSKRQRLRRVLIITGRGLNSGEQGPVLRDAVTRWLERNGGPYVREYSPAPQRHGGEGALWVELK